MIDFIVSVLFFLLFIPLFILLFIIFTCAATDIAKQGRERDKRMFDEWKKSDIISNNPSKGGDY